MVVVAVVKVVGLVVVLVDVFVVVEAWFWGLKHGCGCC